MQEVTLWFWAALSVVLIVTSFVDGQEVIFVADPDISPVGQVRKSLILLSVYIQTVFKSYETENVEKEAVCGAQQTRKQQIWPALKTGFVVT